MDADRGMDADRAPTRTPVPGWYPDPDRPDTIRYWDGAAWTDKRRPRPGWTRPGTAMTSPVPPPPGGYLRTHEPGQRPRVLWVMLAILAAAAAVIFVLSFRFLTPHNPGPRTITDESFISAANQTCKQMLTPLTKATRPGVTDSNATVADKTEAAATGLDHLIAALRRIPVQPADQARVDGWLAAWTTYAKTGHQVAAAIRTGDPSKFEPLEVVGQKERPPVVDFAQANGINSCTF